MLAEIYTTTTCGYCTQAKMLLKNRNINYKEFIIMTEGISVDFDASNFYVTADQLKERAPNAKTVPQIWLDGNYIGGYTELAAFFNNK